MFEYARSRDGPVLGDMADKHHRSAALLGETDQFLRAGADLAHRAGRALDQVRVHRLDRIDNQQGGRRTLPERSEEHTSELQSLMRNSYAVFCLKKKKNKKENNTNNTNTKHSTQPHSKQYNISTHT